MACIYQPLTEMDIWDQKALLGRRGSSFAKVARLEHVSKGHVTHVAKAHYRSQRIEKRIASEMGMAHEEYLRRRKEAA